MRFPGRFDEEYFNAWVPSKDVIDSIL